MFHSLEQNHQSVAAARAERFSSLWRRLRYLAGDCTGATSVEYGLIVGFIAVGLITTVNAVGGRVNDVIAVVSNGVANPPTNGPGNGH